MITSGFLPKFLGKWNCHYILEKCQFQGEDRYIIFDKFSKPIRDLSGGVALGQSGGSRDESVSGIQGGGAAG